MLNSSNLFIKIFLFLFIVLSSNSLYNTDYIYLSDRPYGAGMFSVFNSVIGALNHYEKSNCAGITVNFENKGMYYDKSIGPNWWEYYFKPINIGSAKKATVQVISTQRIATFATYAHRHMPYTRANELIQRYIKPRSHIKNLVKKFIQKKYKNFHIIGVHYRGTDKISEAKLVPYRKMFNRIRDIAGKTKKRFKIFVATDDANFLKFIKAKFPKQIIARKVIRSSNEHAVHSSNKGSPYKRGEDALVDCILLSKCDVLIKTESNLNNCAVMFNPKIPVFHVMGGP